jgi:hypothetical protein
MVYVVLVSLITLFVFSYYELKQSKKRVRAFIEDLEQAPEEEMRKSA